MLQTSQRNDGIALPQNEGSDQNSTLIQDRNLLAILIVWFFLYVRAKPKLENHDHVVLNSACTTRTRMLGKDAESQKLALAASSALALEAKWSTERRKWQREPERA